MKCGSVERKPLGAFIDAISEIFGYPACLGAFQSEILTWVDNNFNIKLGVIILKDSRFGWELDMFRNCHFNAALSAQWERKRDRHQISQSGGVQDGKMVHWEGETDREISPTKL